MFLLLSIVLSFLLLSHSAWAQWAAPNPGNNPYLLTADQLDYDDEAKTAEAHGHAELSNGQTLMQAQSLFYDENKDVVAAQGDVWILQPDRSVIFTQDAHFANSFTQGYASPVGMRLADDSRLIALQARRINSRYTIFDKGVFSPCLPCVNDPRGPPLWQVKARRVTHDMETHDLMYHDATMEMWGYPMFYIPYFSAPDPTVKRRSGFLTPTLGRNSNVGVFVTTPYYYTFSPDFDITIRPTFSGEDGVRWENTLRKRFEHGEIQFTDSLVIADRTDDDGTTKQDQIRGHLVGFAHFDLNSFNRTGAEFAVQTDKSYSQRYNEPLEDILTNRIYFEHLVGRDFGAAEFFYFQNNRPGPQPEEPTVLPRLRYSAFGEPDMTLGGRWSFGGLADSLMRDQGTSDRRVGADLGWERRDVAPGGVGLTWTGHIRDDLFWADNLPDPTTPSIIYNNSFTNRLFPVGQVAANYPLAQDYGWFSHIIEPIVSLTASPTFTRNPRIANEDSQDVEFDATNLFAINRYPGTDQEEQGARMAYGLRNAFYGPGGGWGEFLFGQSYRITDDPLFPTSTGLDTRFSDYVGEILTDPGPWLHFDYLFRLDKDELNSRKHDVKADFGVPEFRPNVEFTYLNEPVVAPGAVGHVEELKYGFSSLFAKYWTFNFDQTRDLLRDNVDALVTDVGLTYSDECMTAGLTWTRNFTDRPDVNPGNTIFFRIYFKYLGGLDSGHAQE